ncbi:outer membrane protein assembly factor BamE [Saccharophagus degradans]|uniref:outer membrane protein assembly factor BamE n=1 Tax=Saccharophagus degradans TaxID=86304 RepID=UPI001C091548|nr:outer membrane protein assembly factor BamE [Saccharophagus degradans]MBU2984764.1 outer membrane protein assembly factor BamE [Saccharophagus degradans]
MQKVVKTIVILFAIGSLVACSSFRFPGVYKVRVQQGNYIEKKMVDQLEVGMTRRQVQYVMGSPLLEDTFNTDRWDYLFMVKRGGEVLVDRRFTVYFNGDSLAKWETDIEFKDDETPQSSAEKEEVPDPKMK